MKRECKNYSESEDLSKCFHHKLDKDLPVREWENEELWHLISRKIEEVKSNEN